MRVAFAAPATFTGAGSGVVVGAAGTTAGRSEAVVGSVTAVGIPCVAVGSATAAGRGVEGAPGLVGAEVVPCPPLWVSDVDPQPASNITVTARTNEYFNNFFIKCVGSFPANKCGMIVRHHNYKRGSAPASESVILM